MTTKRTGFLWRYRKGFYEMCIPPSTPILSIHASEMRTPRGVARTMLKLGEKHSKGILLDLLDKVKYITPRLDRQEQS